MDFFKKGRTTSRQYRKLLGRFNTKHGSGEKNAAPQTRMLLPRQKLILQCLTNSIFWLKKWQKRWQKCIVLKGVVDIKITNNL